MTRDVHCPSRLRVVAGSLLALAISGAATPAAAQARQGVYDFRTLAGVPPNGSKDGVGAAARFNGLSGVAVDAAGTVYVADTLNHTIRKITTAAVVTTLAGSPGAAGNVDGVGRAARFNSPGGIAVDAAGTVYVADSSNHTVRTIAPDGTVRTVAGLAGRPGDADGTGNAARFSFPSGIAVDSGGNLYVADVGNVIIRKIMAGGIVTTLAGSSGIRGSGDGTGSAARFESPEGIAVDAGGTVYVADTGNVTIRKITAAGVVTTVAGSPGDFRIVDGSGAAARFLLPVGISVDGAGIVYVTEGFLRFSSGTFVAGNIIRKITSDGAVTTLAGLPGVSGSVDGTGSNARFFGPSGVAATTGGTLFVADTRNNLVRTIAPGAIVTTFAGSTVQSVGSADGAGDAARFNFPRDVAVDGVGTIYVADTENHTIRAIAPGGVVSTYAGLAGTAGSADGDRSSARFKSPGGVAVGSGGMVYVADTSNCTIRRITAAGVVSTWAGTAGSCAHIDGSGSAARFLSPARIAVHTDGTAYVADSVDCTVRMITPDGVVSTVAGSAGGCGTGTPTLTRFNHPAGIAVDASRNVYVADTDNCAVRKITSAGVVSTLAGLVGSCGNVDGLGWNARLATLRAIAVGRDGTLFVLDGTYEVRAITSGGSTVVVSTLAGVAKFGSGSADGIGDDARFLFPQGIAVDAAGAVYVADTFNNTIRVGALAATDADGDGVADDWERRYGLNPTDSADANADPDGDGYTNLQEYRLGSNPTRTAVWPHLLDLNGDRAGDVLLFTPLFNRTVSLTSWQLTNRLAPGFAEANENFWDPGWQVYPANLNADGFTDLLLYDPVRGLWVQAINHDGDGTFTYTSGNWDRNWTIVPADLDGDGVTDIFVYNVTTGVWVKCFVDGSGGFKGYAAGNWDPGWTFTTADLNGDGRDDFFLYNRVNGVWVEAFSRAGFDTFDYPASGQWDIGWQIYPADLNGDGRTDLFLYNPTSGAQVSEVSFGSAGLVVAASGRWDAGWSIYPGDFNNDGRTDLFLYRPADGVWTMTTFFLQTPGGFTFAPGGQWDSGWSVAVTDLNEDGRGDLILSRADGTWVQATNTGAATFTYAAGNWGTGWTVYSRTLGDR